MIGYCAFALIGAVFLVLFLMERIQRHSLKAVFLKTCVSMAFLGAAISAVYVGRESERFIFDVLVLGGLICGMLGDIWLDLKYVYPENDYGLTMAGFISFALGHILYILGLLICFAGSIPAAYAVIPLILGIAAGIINGNIGKLMKLDYGKYKGITMLYGAILIGMTLLSGGLSFGYGFQNPLLVTMFIGGVLFLISDLILSGTYFGTGKNRPIDIITNHVFYYIAQFVIAAALLFL